MFNLDGWIRIWIRIGNTDPDQDPGGSKLSIKVKKIQVLRCQMFSFEGWRLLLELRRPLWRPKDKWIAIFYQKNIFYSAVNFFQFLVTKILDLDPDPDPHWPKTLDTDPYPDPHWNQCGSATLLFAPSPWIELLFVGCQFQLSSGSLFHGSTAVTAKEKFLGSANGGSNCAHLLLVWFLDCHSCLLAQRSARVVLILPVYELGAHLAVYSLPVKFVAAVLVFNVRLVFYLTDKGLCFFSENHVGQF